MASPITAPPARPFTYEDLEGMPDDGHRREIIGGSLVVSPAPTFFHQRAIGRLYSVLVAAQTDDLAAVLAPFDWRPAGDDVYEPDLLVVHTADIDDRGFLRHGADPVLAVEVLSSNRIADLVTKRAVYEATGLASYWIVDPGAGSLLALRTTPEGAFEVEADVAGDDVFVADRPFPVRIAVSELRQE